jgi:signal transduction histidine kinase
VLHDIKNHVSGLSLVVENARRHLANPEFQRDAMAVVERTVSSLRELMGHVAGVTRPPEARPEACAVVDLLEDAAVTSGLSGGGREGLRFTSRCDLDAPVRIDRRLTHRVLVNLLTNAREAVTESGEIHLGAALEKVSGDRGVLVFTVRDSGRGMSEEYVRNGLFRPFASTKPGGLGVGLSQVRAIVESQGGGITVESQPGRGTTFCVRLPVSITLSTQGTADADGGRPSIVAGVGSGPNLAGEASR